MMHMATSICLKQRNQVFNQVSSKDPVAPKVFFSVAFQIRARSSILDKNVSESPKSIAPLLNRPFSSPHMESLIYIYIYVFPFLKAESLHSESGCFEDVLSWWYLDAI